MLQQEHGFADIHLFIFAEQCSTEKIDCCSLICLSTLYLFTIFKLELPNPQISFCVNECTVAGPVHPSHSPLLEANHRMVFFLNIILSAYPVQDGNHYAN